MANHLNPQRTAIWQIGLMATACWVLMAMAVRGDDPASPGLQTVAFRGQDFFVREVDPRREDLRLYLHDDQGHLLRDFPSLEKFVNNKSGHLVFAANAGMFQIDSKPVGLLVQDRVEQSPLNLNEGAGNFFMKPNGVFLINEKHEAMVIESSTYTALLSPVVWATQSGPLLVCGGNIHPDFNAQSMSRKLRSGIGVTKDGKIVFALSRARVTFYEFALLFEARLACPNALFLDGDISAFYVPGLKDSVPHSFGPMFGLVEKSKSL